MVTRNSQTALELPVRVAMKNAVGNPISRQKNVAPAAWAIERAKMVI